MTGQSLRDRGPASVTRRGEGGRSERGGEGERERGEVERNGDGEGERERERE